jgi:hypothetical protein
MFVYGVVVHGCLFYSGKGVRFVSGLFVALDSLLLVFASGVRVWVRSEGRYDRGRLLI